ncbi:MAG: pyrroline-5-carboxylate reductase [Phycisphaerales bacterium]|nr:pyrroline-5-carboxylate reductase [Phycisphaerales bacterium]
MLEPGGRLIVVGLGNMGKAIVTGLLRAGLIDAGVVIAVDPHAPAVAGVRRVCDLSEVGPLRGTDAVLLAVKPQVFPAVSSALAKAIGAADDPGLLVVSIMAGLTSSSIAAALGQRARVVRAMPNTPAQVGLGATAFAPGPGATEADAARAEQLLRATGPLVVRIDESLMDAFTAVAGSGPAHLFYLAEAMTAGAIAVGFDAKTADRIVRQTLAGSTALLSAESAVSPAELRARVTSKRGTTEAAVTLLEKAGVRDSTAAAIIASRDRGRELGKG